jgi:uncharacterized protein YdeI (YjbR/CyaY-like superfamily)
MPCCPGWHLSACVVDRRAVCPSPFAPLSSRSEITDLGVLSATGREGFPEMKIKYFKSPSEFRGWLKQNHENNCELWVGYYKKRSEQPSMTWPESVDEALCFGWIDGIRKRVDDLRYTIRFTPRKRGSVWSVVNIKRAEALRDQGLLEQSGMAAFAARKENKSGIYSYEQRSDKLHEPYEQRLRQNKAAWNFFYAQPSSYRKAVSWWVVSAKQEATRLKRLEKLMKESARRKRLF